MCEYPHLSNHVVYLLTDQVLHHPYRGSQEEETRNLYGPLGVHSEQGEVIGLGSGPRIYSLDTGLGGTSQAASFTLDWKLMGLLFQDIIDTFDTFKQQHLQDWRGTTPMFVTAHLGQSTFFSSFNKSG